MFAVDWPDEMPQITAVLAERPEDRNRNWFPAGHPLAVATGQPHGQSVEELREEARQAAQQQTTDRMTQAAELLAGLGLELDLATGRVQGV
ncbi:hypothetical protein ABZ949_02275 [Micromonospora tulbaghiae]|uniref:hypothetical protein n=1 Tax=Micromonospora tulbaghiae TaxID=479978 RepID=UPI0033C5ECDF